MEIPILEQHRQLEQQAFQWTKSRIEASNRIAAALKHGNAPNTEEDLAIKQEAWLATKEKPHPKFNAMEYDEKRIKMVYHSPDGQQAVSEDLVFFVKTGEDGEPQMLLGQNNMPMFLNAALFDARFRQGSYLVRLDEEIKFDVPHVNHEGKITKVNNICIKPSLKDKQHMGLQPNTDAVIRDIQQKLAPKPPVPLSGQGQPQSK